MPKARLILGLLVISALVIIAMAVYIFTHFGTLSVTTELVLIGIALVLLFVVFSILVVIMRYAAKK